MQSKAIPINEYLSKEILKYTITEDKLQKFQEVLGEYQKNYQVAFSKDETEEHFKGIFNDFFKKAFLYSVNTHKRIDSCIYHLDGSINSIIEVKRPFNQNEMIQENDLNRKAFHEALLYFYEQYSSGVRTINNVIITDCQYLYFFKARTFQMLIEDKKLVNILKGFKDKSLELIQTTADLYNALSPILEDSNTEIETCQINLLDKPKDTGILYRFFDEYHLFRKQIPNDNNSLDEEFYHELLYIMGLEDREEDGIAKIIYKELAIANNNSLMKLVLDRLDLNKLKTFPEWETLADTDEERTKEIALELVLTWVNRILFLKLLEAQLISYHSNEDKKTKDIYRFLSPQNLTDWHKVSELFFDILAKPTNERLHNHIPYLNSSLFEKTSYENDLFSIDALKPASLDVMNRTILKSTGAKNTLTYLLEFLDTYNFGTGDEDFNSEKRLINASVLGLVFEKINGYKDGSVFTPSFITMSMSREALIPTVIQKFNDTYNWKCTDFTALKNKIAKDDSLKLEDLNKTFNSIRICDPAVGSGHFLVSVLNELLLIKYQLKILHNAKGEILSHCDMYIQHDELLIKYNGQDFKYRVDSKNIPLSEDIQDLQETLFHEKQMLIENCLFGVDINPKSAYICQLRLWIELLKNTYYIQDSTTPINLQTLPNIDINIKIGNSLISLFSLRDDFTIYFNILKKHGVALEDYKTNVALYKNAIDKTAKTLAKNKINDIKKAFRDNLKTQDHKYEKQKTEFSVADKEYINASGELLTTDPDRIKKLKDKRDRLETIFKSTGNIYHNSLEWRYEFPEVLDDEGNFLGFDLIIGNPPYFVITNENPCKTYYTNNYSTIQSGRLNIYQVFIKLAYDILKNKGGVYFIHPKTLLSDAYLLRTREFLQENMKASCLINIADRKNIFSNITQAVMLSYFIKDKSTDTDICKIGSFATQKEFIEYHLLNKKTIDIITDDSSKKYIISNNPIVYDIVNKANNIKNRVETSFATGKIEWNKYKQYLSATPDKSSVQIVYAETIQRYMIQEPTIKRKNLLYINNFKGELPLLTEKALIVQRVTSIEQPYRIIGNIVDPKKYPLPIITENHTSFMHGKSDELYYLQGVLSSLFMNFYFNLINSNTQVSAGELNALPIPQATAEQQAPIIDLVKQCMTAKANDKNADITALQSQIDKLVYSLYGLTDDEIRIIENR